MLPSSSDVTSMNFLDRISVGGKALLIGFALLLLAYWLLKNSIPAISWSNNNLYLAMSIAGVISCIAALVILLIYSSFIILLLFISAAFYAVAVMS